MDVSFRFGRQDVNKQYAFDHTAQSHTGRLEWTLLFVTLAGYVISHHGTAIMVLDWLPRHPS